MSSDTRPHSLAQVARAGFQDLSAASDAIGELAGQVQRSAGELVEAFARAADPDTALQRISALASTHAETIRSCSVEEWQRLALLVGASPALGDFFLRHPERLREILKRGGQLVSREQASAELLAAVGVDDAVIGPEMSLTSVPFAAGTGEASWVSLRTRYRELLADVMLFDLEQGRSGAVLEELDAVTASLSDLATAALEAALAVARTALVSGAGSHPVPKPEVTAARLAVIAMGKCGARELNVLSDVDVIFVGEPGEGEATRDPLDSDRALQICSRLASEMMRAVQDPAIEPPLWQVDTNLRPEGRHGALVRSLGSMIAYYERWAKTWEFQALLKARPVAGDLLLGEAFIAETREMVWSSSNRDDFVGSVQRMRERVTEHIASDEVEIELKLGPGGLRDIEFSVQLLQLVHGQYDEKIRVASTLPALDALVHGGYVARGDGERLAAAYRQLRVLEHRLQLRDFRRTALMPQDPDDLRILARASQLAANGEKLLSLWRGVKREVRELHLKIFYAPLLSAVAALPDEELVLGSDEAKARLSSIGFRDPEGAMRHLSALTRGTSRTARIQRNLLPVLLQWLAAGTDPDFGLLAFRRVSEANRSSPWYLRLLRDGSEAAERLTRVLSTSRFAAELLESVPEAVAWLERDELLRPISLELLLDEMRALASRRGTLDSAAEALRAVHRREVLRLALGRLVFVNDDEAVARGLDAAHTALLDGLLLAIRGKGASAQSSDAPAAAVPPIELALIGMGRYGGRELGFSSDIDLLAVYRVSAEATAEHGAAAARAAARVVSELRRLVSDARFTVDLDFDLRPEGKNGPIVRSLAAYRAYYERWSLTWEAQALLRARPVAGDAALGADFMALADRIRYPQHFADADAREVRRIKARVESERLPRGVDPRRHLKLGPGGLSDVEWLVQLIQLQYGAGHIALRTPSTQAGLRGAVEAGVLREEDREQLDAAWTLASQIRSAGRLWSGRIEDSLPVERSALEGIAGVLGLPPGHTTELEDQWFAAARRSRAVVEREFFGYRDGPETFPLILPR